MSNSGKKRPHRDRRDREARLSISERVPKKNRGGNDQQEDGVVREAEPLDPVAQARKALEMFEEVSGEAITQIIPKKDAAIKAEMGQKHNEHTSYLNSKGDSGKISRTLRSPNGSTNKNTNEKKASSNNGSRKDQARRKEDEEEKARQRKRIEDGEAKRREFRPKIVGLQDSNCLL